MFTELKNADELIYKIELLSKGKLFIVGAGKYGQIFGEYFNKYRIPWLGYADRNVRLKEINGKTVFSYQEAAQREAYYFVSSYIFREELVRELEAQGIDENKIIVYKAQIFFYEIYEDLISWKTQVERLKKIKGIYKGKRCFVIGNGPSLKIEDLNKIGGEYSFACNSIYALYSQTDWRPSFYCAIDAIFCKEMMSDKDNMKRLIDGCKMAFTSIVGEGIQYRNDPDFEAVYFTKSLFEDPVRFSSDCSEQVYSGGTVTYAMLQLAVYMGFKEIYLVGIDFSFSVEQHKDGTVTHSDIIDHMPEMESEERRFHQVVYERYSEKTFAAIDLQLAGYQEAKKYADKHGVKIFNATRGGKLEVFERVNFDELF